jgi:hypothetical protein
LFYSKQNNGFYSEEINGKNIPNDAVKITKQQYISLLEGQADGKQITSDSTGNPCLVDAPEQVLTGVEIEVLRLKAYADPVNGSDRYFAESISLQAEGFSASSLEVKTVKQKGVERKKEIKLQYPWSDK